MPRPRYRQDPLPLGDCAPPPELYGPEQAVPVGLERIEQGQLGVVPLKTLFWGWPKLEGRAIHLVKCGGRPQSTADMDDERMAELLQDAAQALDRLQLLRLNRGQYNRDEFRRNESEIVEKLNQIFAEYQQLASTYLE